MYKYDISELPNLISELSCFNINDHNHNTKSGSCLHTPLGRCEATRL